MSDRIVLSLFNAQQGHQQLTHAWTEYIKPMLMGGHRLRLVAEKETRTLEQNSRLWALLTDVSNRVEWYGNKLTPDEWKDVFTAALKKEKVVPGINGGFVVLGQRTSKMTKAEMVELQDLIEAFGVEKGVKFND